MHMEIVFIILLALLNGFFSATEMAYVVANKIKIEIMAMKKNVVAQTAMYFLKNNGYFFSATLLGANLASITFTTLITLYLSVNYGYGDWSVLLTAAAIILFIGELIPKFLARETADSVIMISVVPVRIISWVLYPVVKLLARLSGYLSGQRSIREDNIDLLFSRNEIRMLLKESQNAGVVNPRESDILNRIIDLGDQRVYEAMRPRIDIVGAEINSTIDEILQIFIESGYSKIPVYEDSLDNIKGVVFAYDLFRKPEKLSDIMREVIFVPDTKKSTEMLKEFLEKRVSFAVAIDEFGGTAGILTMEDIIEELFGEIKDEYDTDEEICRETAKDTYVIGGKVEVDHINELFGIEIPEGDYATLGGYITFHLGRIPQKGETLTIGRFQILILRSNQIRVELVKIKVIAAES